MPPAPQKRSTAVSGSLEDASAGKAAPGTPCGVPSAGGRPAVSNCPLALRPGAAFKSRGPIDRSGLMGVNLPHPPVRCASYLAETRHGAPARLVFYERYLENAAATTQRAI